VDHFKTYPEISLDLQLDGNLMADHWIPRNAARQPLGNPLKYGCICASRSRSDCLSSVPSHNPLGILFPGWSWETTSWRDSKLRAKPSVLNARGAELVDEE